MLIVQLLWFVSFNYTKGSKLLWSICTKLVFSHCCIFFLTTEKSIMEGKSNIAISLQVQTEKCTTEVRWEKWSLGKLDDVLVRPFLYLLPSGFLPSTSCRTILLLLLKVLSLKSFAFLAPLQCFAYGSQLSKSLIDCFFSWYELSSTPTALLASLSFLF